MNPLYRPSELFKRLEELGVQANKRLSQNFLIDGNIIQKIVAAAEVSEGDVIIEVGPGLGALTEALLAAKARVIAIEKDGKLAKALQERHRDNPLLQVIEADILDFPLSSLELERKAKVVANLPYHITTPILEKFAPLSTLFSSLTLMVQKEVADRFVAQKGSKDYSSFTLFLQFYSDPSYCFTIEPTCFYPRPTVRSAVVRLNLKSPPKAVSEESFFKITRGAFQKRRKMLRSSLKHLFLPSEIEKALERLHLSSELRPEDLSLDEFIQLHALLSSASVSK